MILAVDSSTQQVGLALHNGAQVVGEMTWRSKNHHTVEIAPSIDQLLKKTGISKEDLTALSVALGPGSFTSLRIGLSIVKGMSLSLNIPVIGVPTHEIIASTQPVLKYRFCAVIQAGRGRLAVQYYQNSNHKWVPEAEPVLTTAKELSENTVETTLICGELNPDERQLLSRQRKNIILASPVQSVRRPAQLAEIGWKRLRKNEIDDVVRIKPIYLQIGDPIPD